MNDAPPFLFTICQVGAETALKAELARDWPDFRLAYSQPGFLTFKLPADAALADDFDLHAALARTYGFSLGKLTGRRAEDLAEQVWQLAADHGFRQLHVWQVDVAPVGQRGFEPGLTPLAREAAEIIAALRPGDAAATGSLRVNKIARAGDLVLDCVLATPSQWWVGYHRAAAPPSRWPGGVLPVRTPEDMISRAYLKMREALAWSRFPVKAGESFVEIGSAPGGAAQALLERGLRVTGVDPNDMDPRLLANPHFTHIKKRGADLKRRDYAEFRWLAADANVAPQYTLDTVEAIVTHADIHIRGLLLTLKLPDWRLAEEIPGYIQRVRGWGYEYVKVRQLAYNRQEIVLAALRRRSMRREPQRKRKRRRPA